MIERLSTHRVFRVAAILLMAAAATWLIAPHLAISVLAGGAWNAANLWCLTRLLLAWLGPRASRRRVVGWLLIKFPLLYVMAFLLLRVPESSALGFGIGFTLVLFLSLGWYAKHLPMTLATPPHGR